MPVHSIALLMLFMAHLDAAFGRFPHPDPFDHTTRCGTCNGTGAAQCESQDCVHRCVSEGKQCFKPSRYKLGCCCDPAKIPAPNEFKCRLSAADSSSCKWECCQAVHYGQRTVSGTLCGDGCCSPSDHGALPKCGWSLYVTTTGSRDACCRPDGAPQDQQTRSRCCIHGAGVNCTSPSKTESCCVLKSTTHKHTGSSDPHAACQRLSCKWFVPCPGETGALCSSLDRKVCCLKEREPSVHDPCQRSPQDCDSGGRYVPCGSSDARGIDCSSRSGTSVCCLPGGRETRECRRLDCSSFRRERLRERWALISAIVLPIVAIALLLIACRRRLKSLWQRWRASLASGGRGGQLLLPSGSILLASPLIIHTRRIVLNITCQRYLHYDELRTAYRDGDELRDVFYHLAYDHVIEVRGVSRTAIEDGFREALQRLAGTNEALLVVHYAGHAVELHGAMMWAPEDARQQDMDAHVNVTSLFRDIQDVHMPQGMARFGGEEEARRLFVVVLANCCRVTPDVEGALGRFIGHCDQSARFRSRRARDRPSLCFIYSCDPGRTALDSIGASPLSPFVQEVVRQLPVPQSVDTFSASVAEGLKAATAGAQRLWRREVCSADFQRVCLGRLPRPGGRAASGISTASSSSLLPESSSAPEVTRPTGA